MHCPSCGTEYVTGMVFCNNCGQVLPRVEPQSSARLMWLDEVGALCSMPLSHSVSIGRIAGNDIVIPDSALSRQHARVDVTADGVSVVDLGSLNGIYVNDEPVRDSCELHHGDTIRIGRTTITLHAPDLAPAPSSPDTELADGTGATEGSAELSTERTTPLLDEPASIPESTLLVEAVPESAPFQTGADGEKSGDEKESLDFAADGGDGQHPAAWNEPWSAEQPRQPIEFNNHGDHYVASESSAEPMSAATSTDGSSQRTNASSAELVPDDLTVLAPSSEVLELQWDDASGQQSATSPEPAGYLVLNEIRTPLYTVLTIGRAEGNDIRMDADRMMSRSHARFEARGSDVWLIDLESANGSFVNGERVADPTLLHDGDEVRCGGAELRFEMPAPLSAISLEDSSATLLEDDPADDMTLQGTEAYNYIREAEVAEFQALRGGDVERGPSAEAESAERFRLVVTFGAEAGTVFPLTDELTVIGRAAAEEDYAIQLNDRAVSRPHCRISRDPEGYIIQDLESANGTWLNYTDEINAPRRLGDGDTIKVGKTTLVFRVPATIRPTSPAQTLDPNLAQIVTFFSLKGGVGTTTLAVNMAVLLRQLTGQAVLLVDLSTERGAASVHLNLAPKLTLADLPADPLMIDADVIGSLITNHSSGVDVLTAPPSPQSAELVTPSAIASILPVVRGWYKWIVIDTSATFSELNLGVFDQSDLLMLVCAPDLASLKVTQATLDILAALQMPADKRVLVLNNTTPRFRLPRDEIERTLGERIGLFVPYSEEVLDSIDRGVPISLGNQDEPLVEAVCSFAAQLAQVKREAEVQARRGGLGGWVQSIVSSLRR